MTSPVQAQDAIRTLNGSVHGGRPLLVNEARPKLYSNRERELLSSRDHRRHHV
jgi:RNA recognition motif-containing protein